MPKVISISAIVGFVISLLMLVALSFYATVLRTALIECRNTQASLTNQRVVCENKVGVLQGELKEAHELADMERERVKGLESRLDAAGAVRRCAGGTFNLAAG